MLRNQATGEFTGGRNSNNTQENNTPCKVYGDADLKA